ncbi:MAG: LysR family transcriptional regulator [Clostridiales bacterium]|nr:LysR family transcriptional regulator [Clostridiales bacterium]
MDTRVLEYFLTAVREENITKAAEILHITQPTLSRQLSKMEEDLGVQLFVRGKKGITLTNEGVLFRRRTGEIVELAEKAQQELMESDRFIDGEISIGCGEMAAVQLIPKLFMSFKEKYPKVHLNLYTGNADQIKQHIDSGLTDIGLLLEPVEVEKYKFIRLNIVEKWIVLMPASDSLAEKQSVSVNDLTGLPLILPHRQSVRNEIESWFGEYWDKLNIVAVSNLSTNASILVESGVGYALVIEGSLPYLDKSKVTYRALKPEKISTSVLVWKKHQPFSLAVSKFLEHIQCSLRMDDDEI